jgi:HopJ type III effector protein
MTITTFLEKLKTTSEAVSFQDTIATVEANYTFVETKFINGSLTNEVGQNSGSCKLFAFAQLQNLSKEDTLHCFGDYYRKDVLQDPNGDGHQNIRNFMKTGWEGIHFFTESVLLPKTTTL